MTNIDSLIKGLNTLHLNIEHDKLEKFKKYKELLLEWNDKINITAITDEQEVDIKHFLDSLTILKTESINNGDKIIDVGTGGGFPGIPLKIVNDKSEVVLLDSLNKRIKFLNEVINNLNLTDIRSIHGRAEEYGKIEEYREKFDVVVSRAVASLNILSEYCLPFAKIGGFFIAMKSSQTEKEIIEAELALDTLGGRIEKQLDVELPFIGIVHRLIIIKKIKNTPVNYPRNPGKPKKNPL